MKTISKALSGLSKLGSWQRLGMASVLIGGMALGCGGTSTNTAPTITSFSPGFGGFQLGTTVTVLGTGFSTGLSNVQVGGVTTTQTPNSTFSDTQLTFTVPAAAATGPVTVETAGGTAYSVGNFVVVPTATTIIPASKTGAAGTLVTVNGYGLLGVSSITMTGPGASTTEVTIPQASTATAQQLTFDIPANAVNGVYTIALNNPYGTYGFGIGSFPIQFTVSN